MNEEVYEAAARWQQAQASDDVDWDAFGTWLEVGEHRQAYEELALLDERIDRAAPALARLVPTQDDATTARRRWPFVWASAAAACIAFVVGAGVVRRHEASNVGVAAYAAPRADRWIKVADRGGIMLSRGSRLRIASNYATLEGRAYFDIRHDPANPLVVRVGGYKIRDVGTRFEVTSGAGMLSVAVAQGNVAVGVIGFAGETLVNAGQFLTAVSPNAPVRLGLVKADTIGRPSAMGFSYEDTPIALVAADLTRLGGVPMIVDPAIARRRFSGTIHRADAVAMAEALAKLTGLEERKAENAIRLVRAPGG